VTVAALAAISASQSIGRSIKYSTEFIQP